MRRRDLITTVLLAGGLIGVMLVFVFASQRPSGITARPAPGGNIAAAHPLVAGFPAAFPLFPGSEYLGSDLNQGRWDGASYARAWFVTTGTGTGQDADSVARWYDSHLVSSAIPGVTLAYTDYGRRYTMNGTDGIVAVDLITRAGEPTTLAIYYVPVSR